MYSAAIQPTVLFLDNNYAVCIADRCSGSVMLHVDTSVLLLSLTGIAHGLSSAAFIPNDSVPSFKILLLRSGSHITPLYGRNNTCEIPFNCNSPYRDSFSSNPALLYLLLPSLSPSLSLSPFLPF